MGQLSGNSLWGSLLENSLSGSLLSSLSGSLPGSLPGQPFGAISFSTCVFHLFIGIHGSHALAGGILTITEEFGVAEPEEDE